jgi:agmatine deiminase
MKLTMPPEWERHERTWMAWPSAPYTLGESAQEAEAARTTWANVANAIARFEPVSMLASSEAIDIARAYLHPSIEIIEAELDDAWMRDIGPTFVRDEQSNLVAVNWVFNGWGAQPWATWDNDALVGSFVGALAGAEVLDSDLINEGGGIHVNGNGVVLLTETVQLGEGRNSDWSKSEVEEEIHQKLGTKKAIWIKRGLTRDYDQFGTRGHIDIVACFASENVLLYHDQQNPEHPDFEISKEVYETLSSAGDFELVALPAPKVLRDSEGFVDYSYINHYIINDAVILCSFNDPNDEVAKSILEKIYPAREIVLVDARELFARGGGIHCITQQQPALLASRE